MALFIALPWLGNVDQRWKSCEVIDATPFKGDNTSSQPWMVQIRTTDCQNVLYSHGVTEENVHQIASSIESGPYELKMGWMSRRLAEGWLPTMAPSTEDFRPVIKNDLDH